MDPTKILELLLGSGPLAALLFFLYWTERKERIAAQAELKQFLTHNADRLLEFSEEQRSAMSAHDTAIEKLLAAKKEKR
tara:strand:- start:308 stop:544 length:237 start_codon:yes stop_codon:yes gene_type:complete